MLWFAEKFVSLLIEQHHDGKNISKWLSCDLLKNSYLCLLNNTLLPRKALNLAVVICWKIRIFAYWTTPYLTGGIIVRSCDLLKNSYLCLLNNTFWYAKKRKMFVVICWKIRIFAYWTTPTMWTYQGVTLLWFAEKFVSLLIEQHHSFRASCKCEVVICWKIRIFAYWTTPYWTGWSASTGCDLLKNSYLCLLNNTSYTEGTPRTAVVICWKIRIFAYWTTPNSA